MKITSFILGAAAVALLIVIMALGPRVFGPASEATAASSHGSAPASDVEVKIDNFAFAPETITVAVGSSVRWVNRDEDTHNIVGDDKSFKSKALDTNDEFSFTFSKPGTYSYVCSIHPRMKGKVVVE